MEDLYYQITPPNTCGLLFNSDASIIVYNTAVAPGKIWPGAGLVNFEQFATSDAALARAKELNPNWDPTPILGRMPLEAVSVSDPQVSAYVGHAVTFTSEYASSEASAVIGYEWLNPGGLVIPGADKATLTLSNLSEAESGSYTCNVSAVDGEGRHSGATNVFTLKVYPAIVPGASELA